MPCVSMNRDVATSTVTILADNGTVGNQTFTLSAPTGKVVLSGGYQMAGAASSAQPYVSASRPTTDGTGWTFVFRNNQASLDRDVTLYVVYEDA